MYLSEQLIHPDDRRLRLSSQLGVRHVVVDNRPPRPAQASIGLVPWNPAELTDLRLRAEGFGLHLEACVLDTGSVVLDSMIKPDHARMQRAVAIDNIARAAEAGIDCLSYDVQMTRIVRTAAVPGRGGVLNSGFVHGNYQGGHPTPPVSERAAWNGIEFLLEGLLPAAEAAGVRLACQPHDPAYPVGGLDGVEHVMGSPEGMRQFLALSPSRFHGLNFCQGTVAGMFREPAKALIPVIEEFAATGRVFLARLGNIRGGYLHFEEVFPDEGDIDMYQAIKAYQRGGYAGSLSPGAVPASGGEGDDERFAGFALGYLRGLMQSAGVSPG